MNIIPISHENHKLSVVISICRDRLNPAITTTTTTLITKEENIKLYESIATKLLIDFMGSLAIWEDKPGVIIIPVPKTHLKETIRELPAGNTLGMVFVRKATTTSTYPSELLGKIWEYELCWVTNLDPNMVEGFYRTKQNNKLTIEYIAHGDENIAIERTDASVMLTFELKEETFLESSKPSIHSSYLLPTSPSFTVLKKDNEVSLVANDCENVQMHHVLLETSEAFHKAYGELKRDIVPNILTVVMNNTDAIRAVAPWTKDSIHVFAIFIRQPRADGSMSTANDQTYQLAWVLDQDEEYSSTISENGFAIQHWQNDFGPDTIFKITRKHSGTSELNVRRS